MHLGLKQALFAPYSLLSYRSRVPLAKFQMAPHTRFSNILWVQKEGTQIGMPDCGQGLTLSQNVDRGFLNDT
jgi:hypothetical protein